MKGGLVIRITPDDVGRRVSIRSRIAAAEGEPSTSDTVGRLIEWQGGILRVERRDGSLATLAADQMLAGKVIPDQPPRRAR